VENWRIGLPTFIAGVSLLLCIIYFFFIKISFLEFPGGLAVRIRRGHCCGTGFILGLGPSALAWDLLHAAGEARKKKKSFHPRVEN